MRVSGTKIQQIEKFRSHGKSIPEISQELNIPKTTVYRYARNVQILPEFHKQWVSKRGGNTNRKLLKIEKAYKEAKDFIGIPSDRDKLLFLSALYWAEGNKKDLILSNTDPDLIKVFVTVLRQVLNIEKDRLRISIRVYEDMDVEKCLTFWSDLVGIVKEDFLKVNVLYGKKQGKLKYGMCRVRVVKGGNLLKKINAINKIFTTNVTNHNF